MNSQLLVLIITLFGSRTDPSRQKSNILGAYWDDSFPPNDGVNNCSIIIIEDNAYQITLTEWGYGIQMTKSADHRKHISDSLFLHPSMFDEGVRQEKCNCNSGKYKDSSGFTTVSSAIRQDKLIGSSNAFVRINN